MPRIKLVDSPIVERVLTFQFLPLPGIELIHIGQWFEEIRGEYPLFSRQQLVPHIHESFPLRHDRPRLQFDFEPIPGIPRCVFAREGDHGRLHQLQPDRFAINLRRDHGQPYLEYEIASESFLGLFAKFEDFCRSHDLGSPELDLCEVIYLNRIDCDDGNLAKRWREVFGEIGLVAKSKSLPSPASLSHTAVYDFPNEGGRLRIEAGVEDHDGAPAIYVKLIGRAIMQLGCDRQKRLEQAHDWVVDGFIAVTTESIRASEWRQQG
jgi:uncharacterized protein (TIGR04255 family)